MVEAGLEAYKFSISWPRLIPNGRGPVNPKGLKYYNNLINELIKHGIQPHVTLYHSDTPQALEDEYNGWISRKILKDFIVYADVCFKEFGDRVKHWTTLNEPNIFSIGGYDLGGIPPGRCSLPFGICSEGNSTAEPYIVVHHMLLAHSKAFKLYRQKYQAIQHGFVGINIYAPWFMPKTQAKEDVIATQRIIDFIIGWIMHPLTYGDYPDVMKKRAGKKLPVFTESESRLIKGSFDFFGLNHYFLYYVKDKPNNINTESRDIVADIATDQLFKPPIITAVRSYKDPTSTPFAIQAVLEYISQAYGNPAIYIQEDGLPLPRNQTLNDTARVKYLHGQIGGALAALRNGSNTKGFFMWSLLDVFELLGGYHSGYGLYYVDSDDEQLRRYPRLSAHWYFNFLKGGGSKGINEVINDEDTNYAS